MNCEFALDVTIDGIRHRMWFPTKREVENFIVSLSRIGNVTKIENWHEEDKNGNPGKGQ